VRHHLGPHPLIAHFLERMKLRGVVRSALGSGLQRGMDHAETLSILVHNVLTSRGALYRVPEWAERIEPSALGLTGAQLKRLNDDRLARSLEVLSSTRARSVFFRLALGVIKDFEIDGSRVHFDTTTVTLKGQYETSTSEPRITYGKNKDHRPDLKQLLFGLNVSSDGAVPLLHHVWSGNRTDDSVHVGNVDLLRELLGKDDFVYVADSKLATKSNLEHVESYGGLFVTLLPRTRKEDKSFRDGLREGTLEARWRKILEKPGRREADGPDTFSSTADGPDRTEEGYRIVWIRSSQKKRRDADGRQGRLRKAEEALLLLSGRVGRGKLRSRKTVLERASKILSHYKVADFLSVEVKTYVETERKYLRRGRPKPGDPMRTIRHNRIRLLWNRQKEALRAEKRVDGIFPLVTNQRKTSKREVLEIYKFQPHLEKRFALTKSEYSIAPIFLKKPSRVVGLIHLYFIAIMCSALIERQVRSAMKEKNIEALPILPEGRLSPTPTTPRILESLANITWHEVEEGGRVIAFPVELNPTQKLLLDLAGVPSERYA